MAAFGDLMRYWRGARKWSQLDLAAEAEISSRHLSFLETGRAQPSRDMVLRLAEVLDVPLRERNPLLAAAGFAPMYRETDLGSPALATVRKSIEFLLERHNPYPAVLVDRHWNLKLQNRGATIALGVFADVITPPINVMRAMFVGMRPFITNWDEIAPVMIQRLHREALAAGDARSRALLDEILKMEGIPAEWRVADLDHETPVIVPLCVRRGDLELKLFSTVTTLGTPLDITLQELRLETFFPADEATDERLRELAK